MEHDVRKRQDQGVYEGSIPFIFSDLTPDPVKKVFACFSFLENHELLTPSMRRVGPGD